jgi:hypothetical protein
MMGVDDFKGQWKVCGWLPAEARNDFTPLILKDALIKIEIKGERCTVTWTGPEPFSTQGSIESSFTYDEKSNLLKLDAPKMDINGQSPVSLQGAVAGLVCKTLLAVLLTPAEGSGRWTDGEPGTFIAEAHPPIRTWLERIWRWILSALRRH